jgi:enamine deaminase RidA (YjgF/YER057c/UK114 family)
MTTKQRTTVRLGLSEETSYGYVQAVQVGDLVLVSGQTGVRDDDGPHDMAGQMRLTYQRIGEVLAQVGLTINDVVDETIYTTDLLATAVAPVRREVFGDPIEVASTLIGVRAIGSPYRNCPALVEIKCTAAAWPGT